LYTQRILSAVLYNHVHVGQKYLFSDKAKEKKVGDEVYCANINQDMFTPHD